MGSLPKLMYGPNLRRGEVVSSPALKDHSSGYMGGGAREGRAGQVERTLPKGTSPFAEKRKKKLNLPFSSLQAFFLSHFNKLPQPNLLFKNLWKMYVKVKRVHCAEKGSSL